MGESQSRYSIVANLTQTKLQSMKEKSNLTEEVTKQKQKIINLEEELKNHSKKG